MQEDSLPGFCSPLFAGGNPLLGLVWSQTKSCAT